MENLTFMLQRFCDSKNINHQQNVMVSWVAGLFAVLGKLDSLCTRPYFLIPHTQKVFSNPARKVDDKSMAVSAKVILGIKKEKPSTYWPELDQLAKDIRAGNISCD